MSSYQFETEERTYTLVDDFTGRFQLLLAGRVTAAAFGEPLESFTVTVDHPGVFVRTLRDGFFCLAGTVPVLFPDLYGSPGTGYSLQIEITAAHYRPAAFTVNIPAGSPFPLPEINAGLAYDPVRLAGRVRMAATGDPVPAAVVSASAADLLLARTPLHFDHLAGTSIAHVALTASGAARTLTVPMAVGSDELVLNSAAGLALPLILQLGPIERPEYVMALAPGSLPESLAIQGPILRSYPAGAPVQPVASAAAPGAGTLARDAVSGTALLPLTGSLDAAFVEIGAGAGREFQAISGLADADGFYVLDGIAGIDSLDLAATHSGGPEAAQQVVRITPANPINLADFRLSSP